MPSPTQQQLARLKVAMESPEQGTLNKIGTLRVTRDTLQDLHDGNELRDDTMNQFFHLLRMAGEKELQQLLVDGRTGLDAGTAWAHSTFYYAKLMGQIGPHEYNYAGVKGWTSALKGRAATDVFAYRYLLIPVHLPLHWVLGVVDNVEYTVRVLDPVGVRRHEVEKNLVRCMGDEHKDKRGTLPPQPYVAREPPSNLPRQSPFTKDCGLFACAFAESIARGLALTDPAITQKTMRLWRLKIGITVLEGSLQ